MARKAITLLVFIPKLAKAEHASTNAHLLKVELLQHVQMQALYLVREVRSQDAETFVNNRLQ